MKEERAKHETGQPEAVHQPPLPSSYYSAALLWNNLPVLLYWDKLYGLLRYARYDGSQWWFSTIDGAGGSGGQISANVGDSVSAQVHNGVLEAYYYDQTNGNLRWAHNNGSGWGFATLDGDGGYFVSVSLPPSGQVGRDVSSCLVLGSPWLFYTDVPASGGADLRAAIWNP